MRIGIDAQLVAAGNRSGLYTCLRSVVRELRPLVHDKLWLLLETSRAGCTSSPAEVSTVMDGARVRVLDASFARRTLRRLAVWNRLDVLLHNLHGVLFPSARAANAYLVPDVIPLAVDYGILGFADTYRAFYERAAANGDIILVFSEHAKRDFLTRVGGSPDQIVVAPLAASAEYHPASSRERLRAALSPHGLADTPYILMVSTLEVRKNHAVLLRAFAELLGRDPCLPHRLVLVGARWIGHEAIFDLVRQLRLEERVLYLGFAEQLPALYAGADLFVFPSIYEGFGLPPLEAMASGVPVLAARATSLPEVVGDAGVLFDPHDVDGLRDAIQAVIGDRTRHDDLARRGLVRAATFSWRRTAALYLEAFALARERARRRVTAAEA